MNEGTITDVIAGRAAWALHEGDTLELALPPECADAWIQDPPAGIAFMGRVWDGDKGGEEKWIAWAARLFKVAFDALKPGAHGAVWALPRTADWTMQALRRAGFEVRDVIVHVFASGFPKSLDVSKAAAGAEREIVGPGRRHGGRACGPAEGDPVYGNFGGGIPDVTAPATADARRWAGWGTALKPASEHWVIVRKPILGTVAANVLRHGTGGVNVDAGRVGSDVVGWTGGGRGGGSWDESACGLRAGEPSEARPRTVANAPAEYLGRVTGYADDAGLETADAWECLATCDCCGTSALVTSGGDAGPCAGCGALRRWACPVARLDEQSGNRSSGAMAAGTMRQSGNVVYGAVGGQATTATIEASEGGASRFFHCFPPDPTEPFWYSPKPSTAEREQGLDALQKRTAAELTGREEGSAGTQSPRAGAGRTSTGRANDHPTVKGFHLIGHLCDLFVPPGGLVLDLTAGSGTLGAVVAHRHHVTGWRCIMGEMDPGYCAIIRARCKHWGARPWKPRAKAAAKPKANGATQGSLFERLP